MIKKGIKPAVLCAVVIMTVVASYAQKQDYPGGSRFVNGFARLWDGKNYFYVDSLGHYAFDRIAPSEQAIRWELNELDSTPGAGENEMPKYFYLVTRKGKIGVLQSTAKWLLEPVYDAIDTRSASAWKVKKGNNVSLFKISGFLLPFEFEEAYDMDGRFFSVQHKGKWGIYDRQAEKLTVPCVYEDIDYCYRCASKSSYFFAVLNGKWGVVNFQNKVLLPFEYGHSHTNMRSDKWVESLTRNGKPLVINLVTKAVDSSKDPIGMEDEAAYMTDGFTRVKKNGKYGMQDRNEKQILGYQYDFIRYDGDELPKPLVSLNKDGHYGVADTSGNVILPPVFEQDFTALTDSLLITRKDGKDLLYNRNGDKVLPAAYDEIKTWYPGNKDSVGMLVKLATGQMYGFYNPQTGKLIEPAYNYLYDYFSEDRDWIEVKKAEKVGLISRNGAVIVPILFDDIIPVALSQNLLKVRLDDNYGIYSIDKQALVIAVQYSNLSLIGDTHLFFVQKDAGLCEGLLDTAGKVVWPVRAYQRLDETDSTAGYFLISRKDTVTSKMSYSIFNRLGGQIDPLPYDTVFVGGYKDRLGVKIGTHQYALYNVAKKEIVKGTYSVNGLPELVFPYRDKAIIVRNGKIGLINTQGDVIIPAAYELISPLTDNLLMYVKKDEQGNSMYGFGDSTGKMIVPIIYDYLPDNQGTYLQDSLLLLLRKDKLGHLLKGYASLKGKIVIPVAYEEIMKEENGRGYLVRNGNQFGVISPKGRLVLPVEFDDILLNDKQNYLSVVAFSMPIAAKQQGVWHYYNEDGKQMGMGLKATINFSPPNEGNSEELDAGSLSSSSSHSDNIPVRDSAYPVSIGTAPCADNQESEEDTISGIQDSSLPQTVAPSDTTSISLRSHTIGRPNGNPSVKVSGTSIDPLFAGSEDSNRQRAKIKLGPGFPVDRKAPEINFCPYGYIVKADGVILLPPKAITENLRRKILLIQRSIQFRLKA